MQPGTHLDAERLHRVADRHRAADRNRASCDRNGEVLSDADLAPLGVEPRRYRANTAAIRAEYAHVSDDFRARRARVVRALLSGPAVFHTPLARSRWESRARANLTDELRALEQ
jgi:predicted metal-dependent HD superfamily phosphohydrolase